MCCSVVSTMPNGTLVHNPSSVTGMGGGGIKQHSGCHIHPKKPRCRLKRTSLPPTFVSLPLSVPSARFTLFFSPRHSPQSGSHLHPRQHMQTCFDTYHTLTSSCVFLQVTGAIERNRMKACSNVGKSRDL